MEAAFQAGALGVDVDLSGVEVDILYFEAVELG